MTRNFYLIKPVRITIASAKLYFCLVIYLLSNCVPNGFAFEAVRDPLLDAWVEASKTSRADMLILGDSMVLNGSHGWDAGMQHGAFETVGLAGTGVLVGRNFGQGEGINYLGTSSSNWLHASDDAFGNAAQTPFGRITANGSNIATVGVTVFGNKIAAGTDYVLDLWGVSGPGGGSYSLEQRLNVSPNTVSYSESGFTLNEPTLITHLSHQIPASNFSNNDVRIEAENMSVAGIRLSEKNATGVTVTSIGYDGQSALDFYQDRIINQDPGGREYFLQQVVEGGSGKLLVPIFEGFNDRNETEPSVNGITDADSPEAFRDNIGAIISVISNDWINAGFDINDLSFLTFGMYDVSTNNEELHIYSNEMRNFATSTGGVSYIDISSLGPNYAEGDSLGYYRDEVHLSREGALYYGNQIMRSIVSVPEPTAAMLLISFAMLAPFGQRS